MRNLEENLIDLISSSSVLILLVGDESCGPCHALRFKIDEWGSLHAGVTARYIPLRENLELCAQMGIMSVPTVIVYMDGRVVEQKSGYFSLDEILTRLERYLEIRD